MYQCVVCGQQTSDMWKHVIDIQEKLSFSDELKEPHQIYEDKVRNNIEENGKSAYPCFCGGEVIMNRHGLPDGGATWETYCTECGYIFDED